MPHGGLNNSSVSWVVALSAGCMVKWKYSELIWTYSELLKVNIISTYFTLGMRHKLCSHMVSKFAHVDPQCWSYTFSSSFQVDSRLVLLMYMFEDWQVDGKYRLGKKIGSGILYRPWCSAILHNLTLPPPFCLLIQGRCC